MRHARIVWSPTTCALAAAMIGSALGTFPAAATERSEPAANVQLAQAGCQVYGPYATMRRANELANMAIGNGYNALAYHDGDGYYVKVC